MVQDYKKINNPSSANRLTAEQRRKNLAELSRRKTSLRLELAELCMGIKLEYASLTILKAFYECYRQKSSNNKAHQILVTYGLSEKAIANFYQLKRVNNSFAIPDILIDGNDIGYPGYYIKKLDTLSDEGAALGASLGKITGCCQYLGGQGNDCTVHGLTSPNGYPMHTSCCASNQPSYVTSNFFNPLNIVMGPGGLSLG